MRYEQRPEDFDSETEVPNTKHYSSEESASSGGDSVEEDPTVDEPIPRLKLKRKPSEEESKV